MKFIHLRSTGHCVHGEGDPALVRCDGRAHFIASPSILGFRGTRRRRSHALWCTTAGSRFRCRPLDRSPCPVMPGGMDLLLQEERCFQSRGGEVSSCCGRFCQPTHLSGSITSCLLGGASAGTYKSEQKDSKRAEVSFDGLVRSKPSTECGQRKHCSQKS